MGAKQHLHQKVCQRYGWSVEFFLDESNDRWACRVTTGWNDRRTFWSAVHCANQKEGKQAAACAALEGLRDEIAKQEAKPVMELIEVFPAPIAVYESNAETWSYFWQHPAAVVGIDTEGNNISPPVLVQISCDDYSILETPQRSLSPDLSKLLADKSIVKVFCDNKSHRDKKCLRLPVPNDLTVGDVVDLEAIADELLGDTTSPRGLSRIVTLAMPELHVRIGKARRKEFYGKNGKKGRWHDIGRFILIEQGKAPPLRSVSDLSTQEQQYAALDAWCTLQAYNSLHQWHVS